MSQSRLFFMRHGQTAHNQAGRIQGSLNTELSTEGILQIQEKINSFLSQEVSFDLIVSSSLMRASQTAHYFGEALDVSVTILDGLQELNFGQWEGLTWEQVRKLDFDTYTTWKHNRLYTKVPGGESYFDMIMRVKEAIKHMLELTDGPILVVTHSLVMMCLKCLIADDVFENVFHYAMTNLDITEFTQQEIDKILNF